MSESGPVKLLPLAVGREIFHFLHVRAPGDGPATPDLSVEQAANLDW